MNDPKQDQDVLLKNVEDAFDQVAIPPMPDVDQTLAILGQSDESAVPALTCPSVWRPWMKRFIPLSAAAILLLAGMLALFFVNSSSTVAYAAVRESLEEIETASFRLTIDTPDGGEMSIRCFVQSPGAMRQEAVYNEQFVINIFDFENEQMLSLVRNAKVAARSSMAGLTDDQAPFDIIEELRKIDDENATFLKEDELGDGKTALIYQVKQGDYTGSLWVDRETLLPIRSKWSVPSGGEGQTVSMIAEDFVWNPELDPKLFSLEVPEGYREQELNMDHPKVEDVVKLAKIYAFANKGVHPDRFDAYSIYQIGELLDPPGMDRAETKAHWTGIVRAITDIEEPTDEQLQEQAKTLSEAIGRGAIYLGTAQEKRDYHWIGGGVKQGTPNTPIAHWKEDEGEGRVVLYADFTVKNHVPEAELGIEKD